MVTALDITKWVSENVPSTLLIWYNAEVYVVIVSHLNFLEEQLCNTDFE